MYGVILALKILIIILFIAIALIIMLLVIPYTYAFEGNINENIKTKFQINCFFGLLRFTCLKVSDKLYIRIYFINLCIYSTLRKNKHKNIHKKISTNNKREVNFKALNLTSLKEILAYLKDIISILKPNSFKINGVYGLEEPCVTGFICAAVSIIKSNFTVVQIDVSPIFDDVILDIFIEIKGNLNLLLIVFITTKFLFKKDIRKIILKKV